MRHACRCPRRSRSSGREDFKLIGTPAKRLDTPAKVNGTAVYGIDVRPPGVKIATLAQSPVFGGRVKSVDDTAAKAVNGVRQIVRLDDAVAVVADHMGAAKKGLAALVIEWDDGPHAKLEHGRHRRASSNRRRSSRAPSRRTSATSTRPWPSAATKVEATYQVPFLAHATMEPMNCTVHVRKDSCEVWVGTQVIARAQAAAAKAAGLPLGQGRRPQPSDRRRLRPAARGRRRHPRRPDRASRSTARSRSSGRARKTSSTTCIGPTWFDRISAGLDAKGMPVAWNHRFAGSSIIARWLPPGVQQRSRPRHHRGRDRSGLRPAEHARRVRAGGAAGHSDGLLAQRRAVAQRLRDRELHRRAGGGGEAGSGRLSAGAPRQVAARQGRARACRGEGRLGTAAAARRRPRRLAAVRLRRATWRRSPKSRCRRMARFACGGSSARSTAAPSSTPTRSRRRSRARIIFGLTAALYGEITLKDGRVEQIQLRHATGSCA